MGGSTGGSKRVSEADWVDIADSGSKVDSGADSTSVPHGAESETDSETEAVSGGVGGEGKAGRLDGGSEYMRDADWVDDTGCSGLNVDVDSVCTSRGGEAETIGGGVGGDKRE